MFNIIILGLTSLCTDIASEMVYPLIPFFLTATLGASPAILGVVEGIAESAASLVKAFTGYLSDRFKNQKALTITGYAASMAGKLLLFLAGSWTIVLGGRIVDRMGKGIRTAPRDALIAESTKEGTRGWAFGIHRAMDTLGAVIGVMFAYEFLKHSPGVYSTVFLWSLIPAGIGVALLFLVRSAKQRRNPTIRPALHWSALPSKLRLFLVISLVFALGNSSNTFLLLRSSGLGFTPSTVLLLYLVYNITYAVTSMPAGWISDRVEKKWVLAAGYGLYGVVYCGFGLASENVAPWLVWGLFGLYGVYSGITDGVEKALISDLAPAEVRGTAIGFHGSLVGAGLLPASLLAGGIWSAFGPAAAMYTGAGFGIAAVAGLLFLL